MQSRISEHWVNIDDTYLRRFPQDSCYWVPFRIISTKKESYLLNEFLLSHLRDITYIAALLRSVPAQLISYEPIRLPYLLPVEEMSEEELVSLLTKSAEEIHERISGLYLSTREMIDILRGKSDSFRKSAERVNLRIALHLLTKKLGVGRGLSVKGRVYLAYSLTKEEIFIVDTGERDRVFEILFERDIGVKEALRRIFKGENSMDRLGSGKV